MYEYMRILQQQFEPKPEFFQNLYGDIRQIHKQLSPRLESEDRKLLLKLIDLEDLYHSEATLHSFISGYRLACCIHRELAEDPVMPNSGYHRMKKLLKKAGLPNLRFHDLRHTFATHALTSGVDAKTLSGILGHTKTSFTLDTYTHVTGDMHRRASEIVGGFMEDFMVKE